MTNNIKLIREIYGATQSDIAKVLGVSRVTLAKWEKDLENKVSQSVLEKMSIFFGVGPECFYDIELDEERKQMIVNSSNKAKEIDTEKQIKKEDRFKELFFNTTFDQAISKYMFAMKMLLALTDEGKVEDLKIVHQINEKMNARLDAMIKVKEQERGDSINELVDKLSISIEDN